MENFVEYVQDIPRPPSVNLPATCDLPPRCGSVYAQTMGIAYLPRSALESRDVVIHFAEG